MTSLVHIVLRTTRLESLRNFYEHLLGVSFTSEQHGDGPEHYSHQLGDILMELYPTQRENKSTDRLGFAVDDLDCLYERIDKKHIHRERYNTESGRAMDLIDPDGRTVSVEERKI